MQSANDLKQLLFSINHKSYPAYKSTAALSVPRYTLSIDHVQAIRSPLRRGSAFMSAAKPLHFRLFSTTHMKSASPSRITCCASCALHRTVFVPRKGFRQKWSAGDKPLRTGNS